jgi:hypothetical protein
VNQGTDGYAKVVEFFSRDFFAGLRATGIPQTPLNYAAVNDQNEQPVMPLRDSPSARMR